MPEKEMTREEFLDYTIKTFQPYYQRPLTHEDAREITKNMAGFFEALLELEETIPKKN